MYIIYKSNTVTLVFHTVWPNTDISTFEIEKCYGLGTKYLLNKTKKIIHQYAIWQ